jgi:UDP:flavonoid glycosyltransferase YjiC (YdhE family)
MAAEAPGPPAGAGRPPLPADLSAARGRPLRLFLGAFGDAGHAFPMIALGVALRARGHVVHLQTWKRWQSAIEREGLCFQPAPEYADMAGAPLRLGFYTAARRAAADTLAQLAAVRPDAVIADILTLGPALAAEIAGIPFGTLIPHVYPPDAPGLPIYSIGARLPRTRAGRMLWEALKGPLRAGLARGRADLNGARRALGLAPTDRLHGGLSERLVIVASFPALEYPRRWPAHVHVVGPLLWEPPSEQVQLPAGQLPLVLIAPSTSQDRDHVLLRAALRGLARAPVRVIATWNNLTPADPLPRAANAHVVPWLSYARTMPDCSLVICHGGHGTLVRALSLGVPVLACPVAGDMYENAARLDWSGAGLRVPRRFLAPRPLRAAALLALREQRIRVRASALGRWYQQADPPAVAAGLVERLAAGAATEPISERLCA